MDSRTPVWDVRHFAKGKNDFAALLQYLPLKRKSTKVKHKQRIHAWLARVLKGCNWHHHTETCKKNGHDGTDHSCRLQEPRLLVGESHFIEGSSGTTFLLRRDQGNMVSYCRPLMMAVPGNQMISLVPEISRHVREHHLWEVAVKAKKTEVRTRCDACTP